MIKSLGGERGQHMKNIIIALMAGTALFPAAAIAQTSNSDAGTQASTDTEAWSREIIVTSQRYEQRLQDVPMSISALGSEELQARAAASLADLQYAVPGLSLYEYGPGRQFLQLRGMSNTIGAATVGQYLDETPLSLDLQGDMISVRLLDMERVEVLRGPQATLYGEGSMGGTIRYIPAAPKFDSVSGSVEGEYNTTEDGGDGYKVTGVVNMPLNEKIAVRVVGSYERVGGYIDNVVLGTKDVNKVDYYTVRGIIAAKPTDRLNVSLMGLYQKANQNNQDFGVNRETTAVIRQYNNDRYTLIQGKFDYDLDFADLAGSVSYLDRDNANAGDLSPFYVPLLLAPPPFGFGLPSGFITQVAVTAPTTQKIFNSELRLSSQGTSKLGWTVGVNYRNLKNRLGSGVSTAPGELPLTLLEVDQQTWIDYISAYAELTGTVTPELKVTAGVRYFHEKKKQNTDSTSFGVTAIDRNEGSFETVNPRINVSYAFTPNSMIFANVSKGFRGGGFNLTSAGGGIFTIPPSYEPDEIWTYEVGTKHQLFGNKVMLDASVYRSEWKRVQSYAFAPGSPLTVVSNSGDVSGWGVDLAASVRPLPALTLSATYSWNNLEFDHDTADKLAGDPVDGAVPESYSASLDFRPAITDEVTGIFRADYQHAAPAQITLRNFGNQIIERPGRDLVNLRAGASFGPVEITVFANNVFDEDAPNVIGPFGVLFENLEQRPRVIGVNLKTEF